MNLLFPPRNSNDSQSNDGNVEIIPSDKKDLKELNVKLLSNKQRSDIGSYHAPSSETDNVLKNSQNLDKENQCDLKHDGEHRDDLRNLPFEKTLESKLTDPSIFSGRAGSTA